MIGLLIFAGGAAVGAIVAWIAKVEAHAKALEKEWTDGYDEALAELRSGRIDEYGRMLWPAVVEHSAMPVGPAAW